MPIVFSPICVHHGRGALGSQLHLRESLGSFVKSGERFGLPHNSNSNSVMLKMQPSPTSSPNTINTIMDPNIPPPPNIDDLLVIVERFMASNDAVKKPALTDDR